MSHPLGLGSSVLTCADGFILLGPDMAGNLVVVLDHKREDLWVCSDHQCPSEGGKDDPIQDGAGPAHV